MKNFAGGIIPFLLFHLVCCGGMLVFLTASGYLLLVRQEGRDKIYLLPLLILGGVFYYLFHHRRKCCAVKGEKTVADYTVLTLLYIGFSLVLGTLIMVYLFIPWWIPNYRGGPLLP